MNNGDMISHLQYADDTLFFSPNDLNSLKIVKRILRWFELFSKLKINFYNSSVININKWGIEYNFGKLILL
jgi:hypothetical protein